MFVYLFSSIIQILFIIGGAYLVYQVFFADLVAANRAKAKETKAKFDSVEKIAQVKLVADDAKEIEKFITDNAAYLSDEMVKRLVERIEAIKTDQVINADTLLKRRIDALEPPLEVIDEPAVVKRASSRRK